MNTRHWNCALATALTAGAVASAYAIESPRQPAPVASAARGESNADARLTDKVVKALNADPSLEGSRVEVKAADGTVAIAGFVPSIGTGQKVERIASASAGAGKVMSSLRVAGG